MKEKVYIVCGPTSSGKTSLALQLCKCYGGEIISADSRQVCKEMDIGTGKTPIVEGGPARFRRPEQVLAEILNQVQNDRNSQHRDSGSRAGLHGSVGRPWVIDGVSVWGYDLFSPDEYFSGVDWAKFALRKARDILKRGKKVFIVGGTGFYLDLLTERVKPSEIKPNFELREELEKVPLEDLRGTLKELNESTFETVDKNNRVRLIRAIEKETGTEKSGVTLSYLDADFVWVGLTAPRKFLYERADKWVGAVWKKGLIEETEMLLKKFPNSSKLYGLVYKTVLGFLNGKVEENEAIQRIRYDLHAYIRRQQTYFKRNKDIVWVDVSKDDFVQIIYNIIDG